jgi:hypothetical protein
MNLHRVPISSRALSLCTWSALVFGAALVTSPSAQAQTYSSAPTVQFEFSNYTVTESAAMVSLTVTLSEASDNEVTVQYKTDDGTALRVERRHDHFPAR